jgi:hypothetical protein
MPEIVEMPTTVLASAVTPTAQYGRQQVFEGIHAKGVRTANNLRRNTQKRV